MNTKTIVGIFLVGMIALVAGYIFVGTMETQNNVGPAVMNVNTVPPVSTSTPIQTVVSPSDTETVETDISTILSDVQKADQVSSAYAEDIGV